MSRHNGAWFLAAGVCVVLAGCATAIDSTLPNDAGQATPAASIPPTLAATTNDATTTTVVTPTPSPTTSHQPTRTPEPPSPVPASAVAEPIVEDPDRLVIPAIEVDAPIMDLGLDDQGALQAPSGWDDIGWWAEGTRPGHVGPAVLAGHVDSKSGPAVFSRLGDLRDGDTIDVIGHDGTTVTFAVDGVDQFPKDDFPTADIYGPTRTSTLRLITCGGPFDSAWGHYLDNVVVSATRVSGST